MHNESVFGFSWDFLDEMTVWALAIGVLIALVGGGVLHSFAFSLGCLLTVGADVILVRAATARARRELAAGRIDPVAPTVMLAGRLIVKAGLLVVSVFVPRIMGFVGTVAGALTFDLTLVVVGSIVAGSQMMRHPKEGR